MKLIAPYLVLFSFCVLLTFASSSFFFDIGRVDKNGNGYYLYKGRRYSTDWKQVVTFTDDYGCLNKLVISPSQNEYPASIQGGISCNKHGKENLLSRNAYYKKRGGFSSN